ncbi:MAG TPA: hypothetical protein VHU61_19255, partial [Solirubrobacteraceae bacterium]|nr:hypothetical protein [Solirubrobacteraceae bacterium]
MLFDLRSRGRRTTVKVIYGSLALLMVVGLVGLGVGTGNSGGILDAGQNGGSGGGSVVSNTALTRALKAVKKNPSAANWMSLMQARYSDAGDGSNYDSSTDTYTKGGKTQLVKAIDAWNQYLKVATASEKSGSTALQNSFFAADVYQALQQYSNEADTWDMAVQQSGGGTAAYKPYLCLAYSAYAAKQTAKGNLAAAQAVTLTPKAARATTKAALKSASSSATTA